MPQPGDFQVNHATGEAEYDDGDRIREIIPAGSIWRAKVKADTGADVTNKIQSAFDTAPLGCTILFDPGLYVLSGFLSLTRRVNVLAYGAIFNWGTTTFTATDIAVLIGSNNGTDRYLNNSFAGLSITRTEATQDVMDRKGIGFYLRAANSCRFSDLSSENFEKGIVFAGSFADGVERGYAYNTHFNLNCYGPRFGYWLDPGDSTAGPNSGWCNQNQWFGGRIALQGMTGVAQSADPAVSGSCAGIVGHKDTNSSHDCNNNSFFGTSIEGVWGRKAYLKGSRYMRFIDCRWEGQHASQVPGVYHNDVLSATPFYYTHDPNTAVSTAIALDGSSRPIADVEVIQFTAGVGGDNNTFDGGYDNGNLAFMFPNNTHNVVKNNVYADEMNNRLRIRDLQAGYRTGQGGAAGTEYASRSIFRGNGSVPPLRLWNSSGGVQPILHILDTGLEVRLALRMGATATSLHDLGAIDFEFGGTQKNMLYQSRVTGFGNAANNPLCIQRGLWVNVGTTPGTPLDADSQFSGLTILPLWYIDASTDRVGIATATPAFLLDVNGTAQATLVRTPNLSILNGSTINGTLAAGTGTGSDVDDVQYDQLRRAQGGRHWFTGGTSQTNDTPVIGVMNVAGGGGALQVFYDSAGDRSITVRIGTTVWSNALGDIEFYDATGATLYNSMFQISTVMTAGRPLCFRNGIWVNQEEIDADTRISGNTVTDLLYVDASTDRVGIGTATPDSLLHVAGKIHGTGELELDGAINHDGTTAGFFGTAPATQPTVTGSRGGNAALASLLTSLAGLGLIVDSTTA